MSSTATDFAEVLAGVERPGDFCTTGVCPIFAPGLEVKGVGPIALPFLHAQLDPLIAAAERAPFGRGDQTLVDTDVRRSWQIDASKVEIHGRGWARSLTEIVDRAAGGLGVTDPIRAELYKLLVYDEGGFFVSHRDTEKAPGMFATLIVVLPSVYTGGELVVRHKDREIRFEPHSDDPSEIAFAAFYADCLHELLPVTSGCRLALVYNLLRQGGGDAPEPPDHDAGRDRLADILRRWSEDEAPLRRRARGEEQESEGEDEEDEADQDAFDDEEDPFAEDDDDDEEADDGPPVKLIYALEHAYTPASLSFEALKGADAARAATLLAAARAADCDLHLAQLSIEESGSAVYTGYGYRRGHGDAEEDGDDFDVIEVTDSEETLSEWRRPDGRPAELGILPVLSNEISPPDALDDMVPDKESFFEATGNEGASFERSYRKAALVVWPNRRRLAVISQGSLSSTLTYLADLARQWTADGADHGSPLWTLAHELSGHMIARWPSQRWKVDKTSSDVTRMLGLLGELDDPANIDRFLEETSIKAFGEDDGEAILSALPRLAADRRIELLRRIVAESAPSRLDFSGNLLARAVAAAKGGGLGLQPADLRPAAGALLAALPGDPGQTSALPHWQRPKPLEPNVLADVLTALDGIDSQLAGAAVDNILAWPGSYDPDAVLIPAVLKLRGSDGSAAILRLRTACVIHLRSRIAEPLAPPPDWKRGSKVGCGCERCSQLSRFLADPALQTWSYKAVQAERKHVEDTIRRSGCDVDIRTLHTGSPHTLLCTKNQASYDLKARQRQKDLADLAEIESHDP